MSPLAAQTFHVQPDQDQRTLASLLRGWVPGKSWSEIQQLIRSRRVTVNGNLCVDAGRRLRPKEVVKLLPQAAASPPRVEDVRIRYVDDHVVIVEKPAGVTSNRHAEERFWSDRRKQLQPTLDELLPRALSKIEGKKRSRRGKSVVPRVRPVHRLDRDTSGLMVFARTVPAERHLGDQFRKHTIHRRYLAVVRGHLEAQTIESNLVRDRGDGRRGSTQEAGAGKQAVTHVRSLERFEGYTLVECRLETGRTHQIRIHLAEAGHPLCGERVYHQPLFGKAEPDRSGAPRIALHAAELGLTHPATGETLQFRMPLPPDLQQFVDRLRTSSQSPQQSAE